MKCIPVNTVIPTEFGIHPSTHLKRGILVNRIKSVDSIRLIAIIAVIAIHTTPFRCSGCDSDLYYRLSIFIDQTARFAVPFFFVVSGYFWVVKINAGADIFKTTTKMLSRIITVFLAWSVIYLIPFNTIADHGIDALWSTEQANLAVLKLVQNPFNFFLEGTKAHLWFLNSLAFSLLISFFFSHKKRASIF